MVSVTRSKSGVIKPSEKARANAARGVSSIASAPARRTRSAAARKKRGPGRPKKNSLPPSSKTTPASKRKNPIRKANASKFKGKSAPTSAAPENSRKKNVAAAQRARQSKRISAQKAPVATFSDDSPLSDLPSSTPTPPPPPPRKRHPRGSDPSYRPAPSSPAASSAPGTPSSLKTRPRRRQPSASQRPFRPSLAPRAFGNRALSDSSGGEPRVSKANKGKGKAKSAPKKGPKAQKRATSRISPTGLDIRNVRFEGSVVSPGDADDDSDSKEAGNGSRRLSRKGTPYPEGPQEATPSRSSSSGLSSPPPPSCSSERSRSQGSASSAGGSGNVRSGFSDIYNSPTPPPTGPASVGSRPSPRSRHTPASSQHSESPSAQLWGEFQQSLQL